MTNQNQPTEPTKSDPEKDRNLSPQPKAPDTEINPGKAGNNTEVDLDKTKIKTYPEKTPPERQ